MNGDRIPYPFMHICLGWFKNYIPQFSFPTESLQTMHCLLTALFLSFFLLQWAGEETQRPKRAEIKTI